MGLDAWRGFLKTESILNEIDGLNACLPFRIFFDSRLDVLLWLGRTRHAHLSIFRKYKKEGCLVNDSLRSLLMQKFQMSVLKFK